MTTTTISRKIAYKRCSTDEDKQNVGRQLHDCGVLFDHEYVEYASGKTLNGRPVLMECIESLNKGDELHFNDMSRCSRVVKDIHEVVDNLIAKGVKVVFQAESIVFDGTSDMQSAMARMMLTVISAVNELFLAQNSFNIKQGLRKAVAEGKKLGAASPKYQEKLKAGEINHVGKSRHANTTAHLLSIKDLFIKSLELTKQGVVQSNGKVIKAKSFSQVATALNTLNLCVPPSGGKWNGGSVQRAIEVLQIKL
tara:strand:- start:828 stop:1583 length:756 start_codon:yes stop_codon:yes gene_type:complete